MLSRVAVIAVCVVGAFCAPPGKICAPDQWSAVMLGTVGQYMADQPMALETRALTATDYKKKMEAFVQNITFMGRTFRRHHIHDFNKNISYEIDTEDKICHVRDHGGRTLEQHCIGDADLKQVTTMNIGGKKAIMYEMTGGHHHSSLTTVMADDFVPVTSLIEQEFHGIKQLLAFQYGNFSKEVPDGVFDIPSYCKPKDRICAPVQFEINAFGSAAQVNHGKIQHFELCVESARDWTNKLEASRTHVFIDNTTIQTTTITDWSNRTTYIIDPQAKTCKQMPTPHHRMYEMCDDDFELRREASFTVDGKEADMYRIRTHERSRDTLTVFRKTFEPISAVIEQEFMGMPQMIGFQYGNMTAGIKDNSVFEVPDYCKNDTAEYMYMDY